MKNSCCSTCSLVFGVQDLSPSNSWVVVFYFYLICVSVMTNYAEHLLTYLFAICLSLVRCLDHLPIFKFKLFIFLLLSFKGSLYSLNNSLSLDVSFAHVFTQTVWWCSLDKIFCRAEDFNFNEIQLIDSFFKWIFPLVLCPKHHCWIQVHLDFLLCYL